MAVIACKECRRRRDLGLTPKSCRRCLDATKASKERARLRDQQNLINLRRGM